MITSKQRPMRKRDLLGVIEEHAGGVVNGNHHLVLPLTWLDSPQPELVLPEVTGYVLYHATHARPFASTKTTSVTSNTTHIESRRLVMVTFKTYNDCV